MDTYRITFTIGTQPNEIPLSYMKHMADRITRFTGGCQLDFANGYWREDASSGEGPYVAPMQREDTATLTTTVKTDNVQRTVQKLRREWREAHAEFNPPIKWIHVEVEQVDTFHFDATLDATDAAKIAV